MNGLRNPVSASQMVKAIDIESSPVLLEAGGGCGDGEAQSVPCPQPANCLLAGLSSFYVPSETSALREIRRLPGWFSVFRDAEIFFVFLD